MTVRRRALLGLAAQLMAAGAAGSAAVDEHLEYSGGSLSWPGGAARAAIGRIDTVEALGPLSATDRAAIFGGTAQRVYRLSVG